MYIEQNQRRMCRAFARIKSRQWHLGILTAEPGLASCSKLFHPISLGWCKALLQGEEGRGGNLEAQTHLPAPAYACSECRELAEIVVLGT